MSNQFNLTQVDSNHISRITKESSTHLTMIILVILSSFIKHLTTSNKWTGLNIFWSHNKVGTYLYFWETVRTILAVVGQPLFRHNLLLSEQHYAAAVSLLKQTLPLLTATGIVIHQSPSPLLDTHSRVLPQIHIKSHFVNLIVLLFQIFFMTKIWLHSHAVKTRG